MISSSNRKKRVNSVDEHTSQLYLEDFATNNGFAGMYRTSAKSGFNVTNAFSLLVREILKQKAEQDPDKEGKFDSLRKASVQLAKASKGKKKKSGCC